MRTFIFRTKLLRYSRIEREVEILENASLYKLAEGIIIAYSFDFDHAFGFFSSFGERYFASEEKYELFTDMKNEGIEPTGAGSVEKTKVSEVWKKIGDKMMFLFDYGDNWQFSVEFISFGEKQVKQKYPRITGKIGKAPEQYPNVDKDE